MSLVISSALVLADAADGLSLDHPVIGWHNLVTASTVVATAAAANYPASNLANPATHLEWRSDVGGTQYLTITTNYVDDIDYVGIARHNFGSEQVAVTIGYFDETDTWVDLFEETMPRDDGILLFRFPAQSVAVLKIRLAAGVSSLPRAAVVYVGKSLVLERKIYVGHTPLPHGRKSNVLNGMSESGNDLGGIELGAWRESTIPLSLITPAWYRASMDPFIAGVGKRLPFFFGWRPETYPHEVGFCKLMDDPVPVPVGPSNLIAFDLKVRGIV